MKVNGRVLLVCAIAAAGVLWEVGRLTSQQPDKTEAQDPQQQTTRSGCVPDQPADSHTRSGILEDVTDSLGIDFQHVVGPLGTYFMPESIGAGGAILDYDGDGRPDIYLVNCGRSPEATGSFPEGTRSENRLYRQLEDGTFQDTTVESGLGDTGYGAGCAVGDVDNDGDIDVYITNYGPDRLYLNNGAGVFQDATETAGIVNNDWGTCASFFDYNRDGLLDLFVVNYTADPKYHHSVSCGFKDGLVSYCGPHKFQTVIDRVFRNDGLQASASGEQTVHFTDVTAAMGIDAAPTYGFGVVCEDFNGDQWPDVFVANDGEANRLWINQQGEGFVEEAVSRGVAFNGDGVPEAGMGVAIGDVNQDGYSDLVVSHLSMESTTLYVNSAAGVFSDTTTTSGIDAPTRRRTGWGASLVDLNHDGHLDLPLVHGLVVPCHSRFPYHGEDRFQLRVDDIPDPDLFWRDYADLNVLLMGVADGQFEEAADGGDFCTAVASGRSLIHGDLDNDGDIDLVVTNCGGSARVYRNNTAKQGHWLIVNVMDPALDRCAYGARVAIRSGQKTFHGVVNPGSGYLASNDPSLHFGLGDLDQIDEIVVQWPDGSVQSAQETFAGTAVDQVITIRRGEGNSATGTLDD